MTVNFWWELLMKKDLSIKHIALFAMNRKKEIVFAEVVRGYLLFTINVAAFIIEKIHTKKLLEYRCCGAGIRVRYG